MAMQIIESIAYAEVRDVLTFEKNPKNQVLVSVRSWKELPMHPASGYLSYNSRIDAPGISYNISLTARLKGQSTPTQECILKVKLCTGKELIIGSPFIPVMPALRSSTSLTSYQIDHLSPFFPLELIDSI